MALTKCRIDKKNKIYLVGGGDGVAVDTVVRSIQLPLQKPRNIAMIKSSMADCVKRL